MADKSKIEWTEATWNPIVGCTIVSPGCTHCYAMTMAARIEAMSASRAANSHYLGTTRKVKGSAIWTGKVALAPEHILTQPLRWKRSRLIFVNSMGDLFHESAPEEWIAESLGVMAVAGQSFHGGGDGHRKGGTWTTSAGQKRPYRWPNLNHGPHTFQILTKRAARMRTLMNSMGFREKIARAAYRHAHNRICAGGLHDDILSGVNWPLPNVWLGVSAERQAEADERVPQLLDTPAVTRFVSAEPLLGPLRFDLMRGLPTCDEDVRLNALTGEWWTSPRQEEPHRDHGLDWIIVGGESGPRARPFHTEWAESIVEQCRAAGTACFVKQLGGHVIQDGERRIKRDRKGGDWSEWPHAIRVREWPEARHG